MIQLPETATLVLGDCLERMAELPDGCIDLVVTDPPYGSTDLAFDKIKIDWEAWWKEIHRVTKPSAIIACFAAQPFTTDLINANRKNFRYDLVWEKTNAVGFLSANVRPLRAHESILIFCRRFGYRREMQGQHIVRRMQSIYNPQMEEGAAYVCRGEAKHGGIYGAVKAAGSHQNHGTRFPRSVMKFSRDVPSLHPTQKPLALLKWIVRTYSHAGQLILDPFAGSVSTGNASVSEGRRFIGMESDPIHFVPGQQRLDAIVCQRSQIRSSQI